MSKKKKSERTVPLLDWSGEFITPDSLIIGVEKALGIKFNADLAACMGDADLRMSDGSIVHAVCDNAKCDFYYTSGNSFLSADLKADFNSHFGRRKVFAWVNPPYCRSPGVLKFAEKVIAYIDLFELVAFLVNQDSTTRWHAALMSVASEKWPTCSRIAYGHPVAEKAEDGAKRAQDLFIIWRRKKEPRLPRSVGLRMWDPRTGDTDPYLADVKPWWKLTSREV